MPTPAKLALTFILMAISGSAAMAQPPAAVLRVRASYNFGGHGLTIREQDLFVATDRTVDAVLVENVTHSPQGARWLTRSIHSRAGASEYADLGRALGENRIGAQHGGCSVVFTVAPTAGRVDISWYGRGVRRNQFVVEINGDAPPCSGEVSQLFKAINTFARSAGADSFGIPVQ